MSRSLANKVALVTGASSGIGKAVSEALAAEGVALWLVGRKAETLQVLADRLRDKARSVHVFEVDLTIPDQIQELAKSIGKDPGALEVLMHAAGVISAGRIETETAEAFDSQYECNVRAPYLLTRAVLPLLRKQKGQVIFVNSTAGLNAQANFGAYAATKHALKAVAQSLRDEVNADGIRVLTAYLGRTATPMQERIFRAEGRPYRSELLLQPEDIAQILMPLLQLPPTAEVTDITLRPFIKS